MNKINKDTILGLIKTLEKGHKKLNLLDENIEKDLILETLIEFQEIIIKVGNDIEKDNERLLKKSRDKIEKLKTISLIEKYCDELYFLYTSINENKSDILKRKKNNSFLISKIKETFKEEVKVKKEVVFLPYKKAMWDSLESVYLAFSKDENYNVNVIPVPYYDLDSNLNFTTRHFEFDLYKNDKNIKESDLVDYEFYDLETIHPDIVFIHNPYDNCNTLTSVDPYFYSSNIKRFTEKLIYIPYFVTRKYIYPHFCCTPGVLNSNYVIVEDEEIKKQYLDNIEKYYLEILNNKNEKNNIKNIRKIYNKKILPLGSPKLDRINREIIKIKDIPAKFKKYIEKEDGSKKKVVFYNIGLSSLPKYGIKLLEKLDRVLNLFLKIKEEATLIYRPHPLLKNELLKSNLYKEYEKILKKYEKEDFFILDESPEFYSSLLISDMFYGDDSSITVICKDINIPVLIQKVDM